MKRFTAVITLAFSAITFSAGLSAPANAAVQRYEFSFGDLSRPFGGGAPADALPIAGSFVFDSDTPVGESGDARAELNFTVSDPSDSFDGVAFSFETLDLPAPGMTIKIFNEDGALPDLTLQFARSASAFSADLTILSGGFPTTFSGNATSANNTLTVTDVAPVPLPASGLLLAGALGGLAVRRRLRVKRT